MSLLLMENWLTDGKVQVEVAVVVVDFLLKLRDSRKGKPVGKRHGDDVVHDRHAVQHRKVRVRWVIYDADIIIELHILQGILEDIMLYCFLVAQDGIVCLDEAFIGCDDVDIGISCFLDDVPACGSVQKDIRQGALGGVCPEPVGAVGLFVSVDEKDADVLLVAAEEMGGVDACGRLADAAFPVNKSNRAHKQFSFQRGMPRVSIVQ